MISYEDALSLVLRAAEPLGQEQVPVAEASGRVLAEWVLSKADSPPFNKSAMDGFAVRAGDVAQLPAELKLVGEVPAGTLPEVVLGAGEALRVMTGAPVPDGADMVVLLEHTEVLGDRVRVLQTAGKNICLRGEDMPKGYGVMPPGRTLTCAAVAATAAAGAGRVTVFRRPRAAVLSTGAEVVEPGHALTDGKIFDSNGPMLSSLLAPLAESVSYLGVVGDEQRALETALRKGLSCDLLIVSGGVSKGDYDLVAPALQSLGVEEVFHECAIKPGKPTFFGRKGKALVFGMPGNPLSCFVVFHALVMPALRRLTGRQDAAPCWQSGVMGESFENKPGRTTFVPCTLSVDEGVCRLRRTRSHGAADIVGAADAQALVSLPADCTRVQEGDLVQYLPV